MSVRSKLPRVGTTIFTIMSQRAAELGAVNLGQGFPDYPIDPRLPELVQQAVAAGHNQYAPMPGVPALLEQIAAKLKRVYGIDVDPHNEITVTLGATEALYKACRRLTTKTTIRITNPDVPVATSWAAMNWAEPAKMIEDMAWAARLER